MTATIQISFLPIRRACGHAIRNLSHDRRFREDTTSNWLPVFNSELLTMTSFFNPLLFCHRHRKFYPIQFHPALFRRLQSGVCTPFMATTLSPSMTPALARGPLCGKSDNTIGFARTIFIGIAPFDCVIRPATKSHHQIHSRPQPKSAPAATASCSSPRPAHPSDLFSPESSRIKSCPAIRHISTEWQRANL